MAKMTEVKKPAIVPLPVIANIVADSINRQGIEQNLRKIRNIREAAKNITTKIHLSPEESRGATTVAPMCYFYATFSQMKDEPEISNDSRGRMPSIMGNAFVQSAFTLVLVDRLFNTGLEDISYSSVYSILKKVAPYSENIPHAKYGTIKEVVAKGIRGDHTGTAGFFRYTQSFAASMHPDGAEEGIDSKKVGELLRLVTPRLNSKDEAAALAE